MAFRSNLAYFAGITGARLFLEADKGGKTGNSGDAPEAPNAADAPAGGTLKAQLEASQKRVSELEASAKASEGLQAKVDDLTGQLSAANDAKASAESKVTTLESEKAQLAEKVTALEKDKTDLSAQVTDLQGKVGKTSDRASEQLAAAGLNRTQKDSPENLDPEAGDPIALWETYANADATTRNAMRAQHGKKLDAAAVAYDRAQKASA